MTGHIIHMAAVARYAPESTMAAVATQPKARKERTRPALLRRFHGRSVARHAAAA